LFIFLFFVFYAVKLTAFVISAFILGTLGGLYFYFQSDALPQYAFNPFFDLTIALMAFIGGFGTLSGPIFGALLLEPYLGWAQQQVSNTYAAQIVLGVLFLVRDHPAAAGDPADRGREADRPPGQQAAAGRRTGHWPAARPAGRRDRGRESRRADHQERVMTALLRTEGVSKAFGGVQALSDCTIEVERGSIAGLIGPKRLREDHPVQHDHRLRAGGQRRRLPERRQDHQPGPGQGLRAGDRQKLSS